MKDHVTNLELSKTLRELGFPQESKFYWDSHAVEKIDGFGITSDGEYSAYLASELGEWLPMDYCSSKTVYKKSNKKWVCDKDNWRGEYPQYANNECDARAKMLIYLAENKLINAKELCHQLGDK
jgi:hypothetical protein